MDDDIDRELKKIKRKQRRKRILGIVSNPRSGLKAIISSLLSVRVFVVCLLGVAAVGQLGLVGVPGFPVDISPADSAAEDVHSGAETITEDSSASEDSDSSEGSGLLDTDLNRTQIEFLIHEGINEERERHGLSPIEFDTDLRTIARSHSRAMGEEEFFSHTAPDGGTMEDRYEEYGYSCRVAVSANEYATGAENIAYTYAFENVIRDNGEQVYYSTEEEIAQGLVDQWMDSLGHKENILREYWENEGIGVYITEIDGNTRVYATQNFC